MQIEAVECGVAALSIVLAYHGRHVPLETLRTQCGVTRDGSKASNLLKVARNYGMIARGFSRDAAALAAMPLPAIAFWNFNHFLVVEEFRDGRVFVNDPALGPRVISLDEFTQSFTGVVLTVEPGPHFKPGGSKPTVLRALARRLAGLESTLPFLALVGLAAVVPQLLAPVFTGVFIDKYLVAGLDHWLKPLLIGIVITALLRALLSWLEGRCLLRLQTRLALASAGRFFWHALHLPVAFYTQRSPGEISTRIETHEQISRLISGDLARATAGVIHAFFFVIVMFCYDVVLTLASIAVVAANLAVMRALGRGGIDGGQRLAIDRGKLQGVAMNGLTMMETIKSNNGEAGFFAGWAGAQAKYVNTEQSLLRAGVAMSALPPLLTVINGVLVLGLGALRVIDGQMSIGMLVAFQGLVAGFTGPVGVLVGLSGRIRELRTDMTRLDEIMQHPVDPALEHTAAAPGGGTTTAAKLEGRIEVRDVSFGYTLNEAPLIRNFNLTIRPGQRIAIVGQPGCGKSTLARLVMGLYQPWHGEILFDGKPRHAYDRFVIANSLAMVDQDIVLFEGSVRDNLTLWDRGVPEGDMIQAAKDACIHDVILARRGGYDAGIDEGGANLSGGQRQRMEIARALLVNPRVLVLDEATSVLDAGTERQIEDNLRRRGCACLIIAQRLASVRHADEIIVLSGGHIVERGTHDALMAIPGGFYAQQIGLQ